MGIFKSLKGKAQYGTDAGASQPSHYESAGHDALTTKDEKRRIFGRSSDQSRSQAQPSIINEDYTPPLGPPPSHTQSDSYIPPPGPPPSHISQDHTAPPPTTDNPPPYHDWTVIPDTSLLPPPPVAPNEYSPTNNASYSAAEAAHAWCARNPLYTPSPPSAAVHAAASRGIHVLEPPPGFHGVFKQLGNGEGKWKVKTKPGTDDAILLTTLPAFFASQSPSNPTAADHPLLTERTKAIYFEVHITSIRDANSGIAIGFAAKPYPPWRLPGWHRASLGIHGDDGRRFVNDSWGGRDFAREFRAGEVVGVGMRFQPDDLGMGRVKTRVFFTRDGVEEGGWEVDEERDAERDEGVEGLMGERDLYPAVGVFGAVEFEVRFKEGDWLCREGWGE